MSEPLFVLPENLEIEGQFPQKTKNVQIISVRFPERKEIQSASATIILIERYQIRLRPKYNALKLSEAEMRIREFPARLRYPPGINVICRKSDVSIRVKPLSTPRSKGTPRILDLWRAVILLQSSIGLKTERLMREHREVMRCDSKGTGITVKKERDKYLVRKPFIIRVPYYRQKRFARPTRIGWQSSVLRCPRRQWGTLTNMEACAACFIQNWDSAQQEYHEFVTSRFQQTQNNDNRRSPFSRQYRCFIACPKPGWVRTIIHQCKNERMSWVPLTNQTIPSLLVQRRFFTISASPMTLRATRNVGHILALTFDVFFPFNMAKWQRASFSDIATYIRKSCLLFATDYGHTPNAW
jgi:hypothetical protein